jgi:hypothetical protein
LYPPFENSTTRIAIIQALPRGVTSFLKIIFFSLLEEVYEDPIVKAEREFFEIIKQEQEARLEQRQKKQDPSAQDLE